MKSEYSAPEILKIVKTWSTPAKITQLKKTEESKTKAGDTRVVYPGIREFYADIKMKQNMSKVNTMNPFFQKMLGPAFDPAQVKIAEFKIFIDGIGRLVHELEYGMDSFLAAKKYIKAHLKAFNANTRDDTNLYVRAWHDAKLNIQADEFKEKNEQAEKKVTEKNKAVFYIPQEKVEAFYRSFCFDENPDIIDKIMMVQATMGLRLIEALSSKVSVFRKNGEKIEQIGTAKMVKSKYSLADKVVSKTPIIVSSDKFMKTLDEVRRETDKFMKTLGNVELRNKYNGRVNARIESRLNAAGIPEHNELKSSHGLRRLYVAYAYSLRDDQNLTFHQFIKDNLGHESGASTANYNTIKITTDKILDKDSAVKLNATHATTVRLESQVAELKEEVDDIQEVKIPEVPVLEISRINSLSKATTAKLKLFKKAVAEGKTSYEQLEKVKIPGTIPQKYLTRNMITKFKKMNFNQ